MRNRIKNAAPGHRIYAYCNVQTKQVLYSLTQKLEDRALKQLPDIGANHTPPSIRRDVWRPLYTVKLPATLDGAQQRLHAFRKLREWKRLHELAWKPPAMLSRPYTEKEIEEMQARLDERGGSKKERVWDIIKREKKKMRIRAVMDQKANSIADLAAVLLEQTKLGERAHRRRSALTSERTKATIAELQKLSRIDNPELEKAKRRSRIKSVERVLTADVKTRTKSKIARLTKDVNEAKWAMAKLDWSLAVIPRAKRKAEAAWMAARVTQDAPDELSAAEAPGETEVPGGTETPARTDIPTEEVRPPADLDFIPHLSAIPAWFESLEEYTLASKKTREGTEFPKASSTSRTLPHGIHVFSAKGVVVSWDNMLEAEFGELWPGEVRHEPMREIAVAEPEPKRLTAEELQTLREENQKQINELRQPTKDAAEAYKRSRKQRRMLEKSYGDAVDTLTEEQREHLQQKQTEEASLKRTLEQYNEQEAQIVMQWREARGIPQRRVSPSTKSKPVRRGTTKTPSSDQLVAQLTHRALVQVRAEAAAGDWDRVAKKSVKAMESKRSQYLARRQALSEAASASTLDRTGQQSVV